MEGLVRRLSTPNLMGWLLDICKIAQTREIKCISCGNKTVDFVVLQMRAFIRCQECGAETEITFSELKQSPKQIEQ